MKPLIEKIFDIFHRNLKKTVLMKKKNPMPNMLPHFNAEYAFLKNSQRITL